MYSISVLNRVFSANLNSIIELESSSTEARLLYSVGNNYNETRLTYLDASYDKVLQLP